MSDSERSSFSSLLIPVIALAIFSAPPLATADSLLIFHNESVNTPVRETGKYTTKRSLTVGLNENGDMMIRHSDVSMILAYNPPNDTVDPQERIKIAQRQDCPSITGISFKVSVLF